MSPVFNPRVAFLHRLFFLLTFFILFGNSKLFAQSETLCEIGAMIADSDPKGFHVRSSPNSKSDILATIPKAKDNDDQVELSVVASQEKWLKVRHVKNISGKVILKGEGWVYAPLTGFNIAIYDPSKTAPLYSEPNKQSRVVKKIPAEAFLPLAGCRGKWAKVQYQGTEGWVEPGYQCSNPVTNCN